MLKILLQTDFEESPSRKIYKKLGQFSRQRVASFRTAGPTFGKKTKLLSFTFTELFTTQICTISGLEGIFKLMVWVTSRIFIQTLLTRCLLCWSNGLNMLRWVSFAKQIWNWEETKTNNLEKCTLKNAFFWRLTSTHTHTCMASLEHCVQNACKQPCTCILSHPHTQILDLTLWDSTCFAADYLWFHLISFYARHTLASLSAKPQKSVWEFSISFEPHWNKTVTSGFVIKSTQQGAQNHHLCHNLLICFMCETTQTREFLWDVLDCIVGCRNLLCPLKQWAKHLPMVSKSWTCM